MVVVSDHLPARREEIGREVAPHTVRRPGSEAFLDRLVIWERIGAVIAEHRLAIAGTGAALALAAAVCYHALPAPESLRHMQLLLVGRETLTDLSRNLHGVAVPVGIAAAILLLTDGLLAVWPRRRTPWHVVVAAQPFLPLPLLVPLFLYAAVVLVNVVLWIFLVIFAAVFAVGFVFGFIRSLFESI